MRLFFIYFSEKIPLRENYTITCGLEAAIEFVSQFSFNEDELAYLASLSGNDGSPMFEQGFIQYLKNLRFTGSIYGLKEGTLVFPHQPLLRIQAPLIVGQLLETALLNIMNFQTLIATKSSRICRAAKGEDVLEFGLRRAQGVDGAMSASRAAYIGGCAATSNVWAGKQFDIPVRGTHAHSWVMCFDTEIESFRTYADALPNNCVFLVDTYDTVEGVRNAIVVGKALREKGHEMMGIRLDSGDLADLSIKARTLLDEAGFPEAKIVASNDLDEYRIQKLKEKGAKIQIWGVGTRLVTAYDQAALGGVYKLSAIRSPHSEWSFKVKRSEQLIKVSNPGLLQVRRFSREGSIIGDILYHEDFGIPIGEFIDEKQIKHTLEGTDSEDILVPIFMDGKCIYETPDIHKIRSYAQAQLALLAELPSNSVYATGLEPQLYALKRKLLDEMTNRPANSLN